MLACVGSVTLKIAPGQQPVVGAAGAVVAVLCAEQRIGRILGEARLHLRRRDTPSRRGMTRDAGAAVPSELLFLEEALAVHAMADAVSMVGSRLVVGLDRGRGPDARREKQGERSQRQ